MTHYRIQVLVKHGEFTEWVDIHPTNGPAYEYATKEAAEKIVRMCYSGYDETKVQIKEIV